MEYHGVLFYALVAAGAFAGAMVSGMAGFAFGVTSLGIWAHVLAPGHAVALVVLCALLVHLITLPRIWRAVQPRAVAVLVAGGLAGVPLGAMLLERATPGAFQAVVGAAVCLFALSLLATRRRTASAARGSAVGDALVGLLSGVMSGFAGLPGLLPTLWYSLRGWSKERQRVSYQAFNFSILILTGATLAAGGRLEPTLLPLLAAALPATAVGAAAGFALYRRVDDAAFGRIVLGLLAASGASLLVR